MGNRASRRSSRATRNNIAPSETANRLQIVNLLLMFYHDKMTERHHRPPLDNVQGITAICDAMHDILRPCSNLSSHELMNFVWLTFSLLVYRLEHGDASDLTQDQVPEPWML